MNNKLVNLVQYANVLVIAAFILLVFSQADKKFMLDAVDFPVLVKAISETGSPFHYRGETDIRSLGLWHPPLFAYSLAAFVKIFGFSENIVRAYGMCCVLLSAYLSILIYRTLFPSKETEKSFFALVFLSIFLLHPYTIANATVPDIDSTLLPVTMLAFLYGLVRLPGPEKSIAAIGSVPSSVLVLSLLFTLNLWTKLTTPLILIPTAFLVAWIKGGALKDVIVSTLKIAVFGGAFFFLTYWLYCYLLGLPFDFTFKFLLFSFTKNSSSGGGTSAFVANVLSHLAYARQFVNWIGLLFVFALAVSISDLIFQKKRSENEWILSVFVGMGIFVTVFYLSLTGAFGGFFKYPFPVFAILNLAIADYFYRNISSPRNHIDRISSVVSGSGFSKIKCASLGLLAAGVVLAALYYQLVVAQDTLIRQDRPVSLVTIVVILGAAMLIGAFFNWRNVRVIKKYCVPLFLLIMASSQLGISRSQAVAHYPTTYHYGQTGFDETIAYLNKMLRPGELIWSMKDIGYYSKTNYYENYISMFKAAPELTAHLENLIVAKNVRYFVVTKDIGQDRIDAYADLKSALQACCYPDREFGNFVVYRAK